MQTAMSSLMFMLFFMCKAKCWDSAPWPDRKLSARFLSPTISAVDSTSSVGRKPADKCYRTHCKNQGHRRSPTSHILAEGQPPDRCVRAPVFVSQVWLRKYTTFTRQPSSIDVLLRMRRSYVLLLCSRLEVVKGIWQILVVSPLPDWLATAKTMDSESHTSR